MAASADPTKISFITTLYTELDKFGKNQEYERALKVANKILNETTDDITAFKCKIVCLVHLGKFEEVIIALKKFNKYASELQFEKAYCEYRLNRTKEALNTLRSIENKSLREQELLAQVLYRIEDYNESFKVFRDLVKNSEDDFEDERETNMAAVIASLQQWTTHDVSSVELREDTYELCYNSACHLIGRGLLKEAADKLRTAETLCKETLEEDPDMTEEEIDAELGIIRVQLGYVLQQLGHLDEAMKLYSLVNKQKPSDPALSAVASNNIVTINKDQNLFDSKKKMKVATADGLQQKLTSHQRQVIEVNQCLLQMYSNQTEACTRSANQLSERHPGDYRPHMIQAASLQRDKQPIKAIDYLKNHVSAHADCSIELKLTLAQMYIANGNVYQACDLLKSMDIGHKPGVVATLVELYTSQEDMDAALETLNDAVQWYRKNDPSSPDLITLIRANADLQHRHGSPQQAAKFLEELRRHSPKDARILAQLVSAYAKFNPEKAHSISKDLPSAAELAADVDVTALEASMNTFTKSYVKRTTKSDQSPRPDTGDELLDKRKRKKRKKKNKPAQNPDAPVDPERWLPRRERSYYRGKRKDKRKDIGKGTQGAAVASTDPGDFSKQTAASPSSSDVGSPRPATSSTAASSAPLGPRQQKPTQASSKKKKKGKGNKW